METYKVSEKGFNGQIIVHGEAMNLDSAYSLFVCFCDERNAYLDIDPSEVAVGDNLTAYYEGGKCWVKIEKY